MKNPISIILLISFFLYPAFNPYAHAQEVIADPLTSTTNISQSEQSSSLSGAASQKSVTTNTLCIKVGGPSEEKPAICTQRTGAPSQAAPTVEAAKLVDTIREQFGVSMQGAWDEKHLQWIYEKFYDLKQQTRFIELTSGQPVSLTTGIPNQETGFVQMSQTGFYADDKDYFLGTLIHEFGHVIYHKSLAENLRGEIDNLYSKISCVSSYSRCQGDRTENYPEVIAYCLNPKAVGNIDQQKWGKYREFAVRILGFCYN